MIRKATRRKHRRPRSRRRTLPGSAPGTVAAQPDALTPVIRVMGYGEAELIEEEVPDPDRLRSYLGQYPVIWINVNGLGDSSVIKRIGKIFNLHPLALEDVVNVHQRAKVEPYDNYVFLVARMAGAREQNYQTEQVSFFIGERFVITFQERPGDCLDPVRQRIRTSSGRIRRAGTDYLTYSLLDAVIDSYFPVVDKFADQLDELEEHIATTPSQQISDRLHDVRNDLLVIRRAIRPHRDAVNALIRDEQPNFTAETRIFLRDCYDHTIQLIELLEVYRETCSNLRDYYLSMMSNRMNEIMKVLTMIATIFIPLSFVSGLYGMNFDTRSPWNMPELQWRFGYPYALSIMLTICCLMLIYFTRKGWLRKG